MDNHDGCIVVLNEDYDLADERIITVYAFSDDEKYNADVYRYFRGLSNNEKLGKRILDYNTGGGSLTFVPPIKPNEAESKIIEIFNKMLKG